MENLVSSTTPIRCSNCQKFKSGQHEIERAGKCKCNNNKYAYMFIIQGWYGYHRWEDLTAADNWEEAQSYLRDYNANEPNPHRMIRRRVQQ